MRRITLEDIFANTNKTDNLSAFLMAHKEAIDLPILANIAFASVAPSMEEIVLGVIDLMGLYLKKEINLAATAEKQSALDSFLEKTKGLDISLPEKLSISLTALHRSVRVFYFPSIFSTLLSELQPWNSTRCSNYEMNSPCWVIQLILHTVDLTERERIALEKTFAQSKDDKWNVVRNNFRLCMADLVRTENGPSELFRLVYGDRTRNFFQPHDCLSAENIEKLKKESTPLGDLKKALIYSHCKEKCGAHFLDLFSVKIINAADKAEIKKIMKAMGPFDKGISELQSVFDIQEAFDFFDVTTKTQLKASWEKMASDVKNLSCFRSFCCNAPFEVCLDSAYALFDILSDLGNNLLDSNVDATKAARHDLYIKIETSLLDFMFDYTKEDTSKSPVKFIREDWNTMLARLMKITYLRKGGDSDRANEIFGVIANPNTLAHVRTNLAARIKFIPGASKKTLESCKPLLDKFDSLLSPVASSVADLVRPSQGGIFDPRSSSVTAKHPSVAANDTELVQMDVQSGRASL